MNDGKFRVWTARLLIGFVLITIGFAAGRRTAPLPPTDPAGSGTAITQSAEQSEQGEQVTVYAAHMTFRCPECTQIEWLARELVENEFADELAAGALAFKTVDYMRNTSFARKYNIASSTIVVTRTENGEEQGFQRLDEVWTKVNDREAYFPYVRAAIQAALAGEEAQ